MVREVFDFSGGAIIGKSKPLRQIFNLIPQLANQDGDILIQGESGTGKKLVAAAIHSCSPRSLAPFVKVNCAALEEPWITGELFGQKASNKLAGIKKERRGFFEIAQGGTLLLDEITKLPLEGQAKLVQVLQEKKFVPLGADRPVASNVRIIAATNLPLAEAVERGVFREDLYFCLQANTVSLPVLRELREDIPLLVKHFIAEYSKKYYKDIRGISDEALAILEEYNWPGNVKELENCIKQAVIIEELEIIQAHSLPYELFQGTGVARQRLAEEFNLRRRLKAFERQLILRALNETNWKKKETSMLLGIDQRNLSYFLKKHHITDPITREKDRGSL